MYSFPFTVNSVSVIPCYIVKNAYVNIFIIKAFSVFGFVSVEEVARGMEGSPLPSALH